MKIERKYLAHFINVGDDVYERLGQDLEEFTPEMSAHVETKRNILGETSVTISGYEKSGAVETYYVDSDSPLFEYLQFIIDHNLVQDDLRTDVVEVKLWEPNEEDIYPAYREVVYTEITSYGGDTTGYQIAFVLHYTGIKELGAFDLKKKTFFSANVT